MVPSKNLPLLMNLSYYGFNRGLDGDLKPQFNTDGNVKKTFCNEFILFILNGFGYSAMNGKTANDMVSFMADYHNGWLSIDDMNAQLWANEGVIVVAGWRNPEGHGHVCLVVPGILEKSSSAGKPVPKVANVGREVFFGKRSSFAFKYPLEQPTLFALAGMML